jgi:predicted transcriptional regulator
MGATTTDDRSCHMPKEVRTRAQLEAMMMEEVRKQPKCDEVASIVVIGPVERPDANWDKAVRPKSTAVVSLECDQALEVIKRDLQARFNLRE